MKTGTGPQISADHRGAEAPCVSAITFLTVPLPPSVNGLYRNVPGVGRAKTGVYKDWAGRAGWVLKSQAPTPVPGRVIIIIGIDRKSESADLDNRVKALFDLLVDHKVIRDDRFVTAFAIAWNAGQTTDARLAIMPACDLMLSFRTPDDGKSGGWFLQAPETEGPTPDGD